MNFTSVDFLVFYPLVLLLYWRLPGRYRWMLLLAASCFFYFSENSWAGLLLFLTTGVTYLAARGIAAGKRKKICLVCAVFFCLGLLIGLKYSVPPVGISFYTFQTLSYVLDVYRDKDMCERNFGYYALFVSFFPQLVAGPVERTKNLLPQLKKIHTFSKQDLTDGFWMMLRGFFKKIVVADYLAGYVDRVYAAPGECGGIAAAAGTVLFALQIYCDFSGYTDIARGAARMLGIRLMENFRHPYRAQNIQDFWRRWHISLTGWFTDYVYIPLGGNRKGLLCQCRNILIVFGLSGLWHGAGWNYVIWGLCHGLYLVGYTIVRRYGPKIYTEKYVIWKRMGTMALVCFAWVFFRSPSLKAAWVLLRQTVCNPLGGGIGSTLSFLGLSKGAALRLLLTLASLAAVERMPDEIYGKLQSTRTLAFAVTVGVCMMIAVEFSWLYQLAAGTGNGFIYFRF